MTRNLFFLLSCLLICGACTIADETKGVDKPICAKVTRSSNPIYFNHAVLVLDSVTYYSADNSEFVKQFAFSEE